jgi:hypothetical protein
MSSAIIVFGIILVLGAAVFLLKTSFPPQTPEGEKQSSSVEEPLAVPDVFGPPGQESDPVKRDSSGKEFIFIWIFIFGAGMFFLGYKEFKECEASKSWPSVRGTVVSSKIEEHWRHSGGKHGRYRTVYDAKVRYSYPVNGFSYSSNRIFFGDRRGSRQDAQKIVDRYSPNTQVLVYYNPAKPNAAVLEQRKENGIFAFLVTGPMLVILSLLGLFWRRFSRYVKL